MCRLLVFSFFLKHWRMQTVWSVLDLLHDPPIHIILSTCKLNLTRIMSYKSQDWTGPGAHPPSCKMGTGALLGVKWPGRVVDLPPHLAPRLRRNRGTPPFPFVPAWPVTGWPSLRRICLIARGNRKFMYLRTRCSIACFSRVWCNSISTWLFISPQVFNIHLSLRGSGLRHWRLSCACFSLPDIMGPLHFH